MRGEADAAADDLASGDPGRPSTRRDRGDEAPGSAPTGIASAAPLAGVVASARARLGRLAVRAETGRHAALLCAAAAAFGVARPLVWPLRDGEPWEALARALVLGAAGASAALAIVIARAWRSRPSTLASARRLDGALGLAEVVASGYAFERDGRDDEMARFAVERARRAVVGVSVERVLVSAPRARATAESRWLFAAAAAAVLGIGVGALDRVVVERALRPVTTREASAAAELKKAADEAAANVARDDAKDEKGADVVAAARRASDAARRGDRRGALSALDDMRAASRALEADERAQARALRSLRDELEGSARPSGAGDRAGAEGARGPARPSATAAEALAGLRRDLAAAGTDGEAVRGMLERLERAEAAARAAAERSARADGAGRRERSGEDGAGRRTPAGEDGARAPSAGAARREAWSRVAAALAEAREAKARGDGDAAKRAMERAERELSKLEEASRGASARDALARLADGASELDRSMHAALRGDPSGGRARGDDAGDLRAAGAEDAPGAGTSRSTSKASGDPSGAAGAGPGGSERRAGSEARRVRTGGGLQARADVREGERAAGVIEGMGRGGDPRAYRELFPSYDTIVEDGLREDTVPAARRPTVRRYFSSIRPGDDGDRQGP